MRRLIALVVLMGLVQVAVGCRHVAGGCDCEHAPYAPGYGNRAPMLASQPAPPIAVASQPSTQTYTVQSPPSNQTSSTVIVPR